MTALRLLVVLAALTLPGVLAAQTAEPVPEAAADPAPGASDPLADFIAQEQQAGLKKPQLVPTEYLTEEGIQALQASLEAYYRYHESGFKHRRAVFDWQLLSSKIIFVIVIALVTVGVYFSWLQFMATGQTDVHGSGLRKADGTAAASASPATTTIEASMKGIKVSSPVLGVIILMISLAFFYLYLVYVYPISELF